MSVSADYLSLETIQEKPDFLTVHCFQLTHIFSKSLNACWDKFNHSETFSKHQIFPYRVEFCPKQVDSTNHFVEKTWTNHHGPCLNAAGQIVTMTPPSYRDIHYTYGSYAISFRLLRPVRLQFFFEKTSLNQTCVRVQFDTYVPNWFKPVWSIIQSFFWKSFFLSINLSIKK